MFMGALREHVKDLNIGRIRLRINICVIQLGPCSFYLWVPSACTLRPHVKIMIDQTQQTTE